MRPSFFATPAGPLSTQTSADQGSAIEKQTAFGMECGHIVVTPATETMIEIDKVSVSGAPGAEGHELLTHTRNPTMSQSSLEMSFTPEVASF